jgi:hypothetical protein
MSNQTYINLTKQIKTRAKKLNPGDEANEVHNDIYFSNGSYFPVVGKFIISSNTPYKFYRPIPKKKRVTVKYIRNEKEYEQAIDRAKVLLRGKPCNSPNPAEELALLLTVLRQYDERTSEHGIDRVPNLPGYYKRRTTNKHRDFDVVEVIEYEGNLHFFEISCEDILQSKPVEKEPRENWMGQL